MVQFFGVRPTIDPGRTGGTKSAEKNFVGEVQD